MEEASAPSAKVVLLGGPSEGAPWEVPRGVSQLWEFHSASSSRRCVRRVDVRSSFPHRSESSSQHVHRFGAVTWLKQPRPPCKATVQPVVGPSRALHIPYTRGVALFVHPFLRVASGAPRELPDSGGLERARGVGRAFGGAAPLARLACAGRGRCGPGAAGATAGCRLASGMGWARGAPPAGPCCIVLRPARAVLSMWPWDQQPVSPHGRPAPPPPPPMRHSSQSARSHVACRAAWQHERVAASVWL